PEDLAGNATDLNPGLLTLYFYDNKHSKVYYFNRYKTLCLLSNNPTYISPNTVDGNYNKIENYVFGTMYYSDTNSYLYKNGDAVVFLENETSQQVDISTWNRLMTEDVEVSYE